MQSRGVADKEIAIRAGNYIEEDKKEGEKILPKNFHHDWAKGLNQIKIKYWVDELLFKWVQICDQQYQSE